MKIRLFLWVGVLLLAFAAAGVADEVSEEYSKLMKPAAAANQNLQKNVETDLAAAATNAAEVQAAFEKVEQFWVKRKVADAQQFAKNVQMVAKETHDAAAAGNKEAAVAAAKKIGANCQSCHMAHRDRLPDGSFQLK